MGNSSNCEHSTHWFYGTCDISSEQTRYSTKCNGFVPRVRHRRDSHHSLVHCCVTEHHGYVSSVWEQRADGREHFVEETRKTERMPFECTDTSAICNNTLSLSSVSGSWLVYREAQRGRVYEFLAERRT